MRPAFLKAQFKDLLQSQEQSQQQLTLPEVINKVDAAAKRLERFGGVFRNVKASIDVADPLFPADAGATTTTTTAAVDLKVNLAVERANPHPVYLKTIVQDDLAGLVAGASLTNVFGGAESVSAETALATSPHALRSLRLDVTTPLNGDPDKRASVTAFRYTKTNPWASHAEETRQGLTAKLVAESLGAAAAPGLVGSSLVEAGVRFEQRSVSNVAEGASGSIKALEASSNNKASVFASLKLDRQNDATYPTDGYAVELDTELAGVLGTGSDALVPSDVSYLKTSGVATISKSLDPVHDSLVFSATLGSGLLWSYQKHQADGSKRTSSIYDRFFLGGKTSAPFTFSQPQTQSKTLLYGYQHNGLGPKDGGNTDSIGGDAYTLGSLCFTGKLPHLAATHPLSPLRFQLFFSGASLVPIASVESSATQANGGGLKTAFLDNFSTPSTCAGAGLVYKTGQAQLEVVYAVPLRVKEGEDWGRKGVQVTAGLELDF